MAPPLSLHFAILLFGGTSKLVARAKSHVVGEGTGDDGYGYAGSERHCGGIGEVTYLLDRAVSQAKEKTGNLLCEGASLKSGIVGSTLQSPPMCSLWYCFPVV